MAAPTVAGAATKTGTMHPGIVLREAEWTLPKAAKGVAAKGTAAKGIAVKGTAIKGAAAQTAAVQGMVQAKVGAIPPGLEWELPEVAKAGGAKGAVIKGAAVKGAAKGTGVALQGGAATVGQANSVATTTGVATVAKAGSGTIWSGTGMKLGWGLGLGSWGPVVLVGVVAAVGVGVYGYLKNRASGGELEEATS